MLEATFAETAKGASIELVEADLASLKSVRTAADQILAKGGTFDAVIANAGLMACPKGKTADGFETQPPAGSSGSWTIALLIAGRKPPTVSARSGPTPSSFTNRFMPVRSTRSRSTAPSFRENFLCPTTSFPWPNSKSVCSLFRPTTSVYCFSLPMDFHPQKSPASARQYPAQIPRPRCLGLTTNSKNIAVIPNHSSKLFAEQRLAANGVQRHQQRCL